MVMRSALGLIGPVSAYRNRVIVPLSEYCDWVVGPFRILRLGGWPLLEY